MLIYNANGPRGYRIANSLRFRSSASAYLSRTPGSAGNRTTWTWSGWVKRGALGAAQILFGAASSPNGSYFRFESGDTLRFYDYNGTTFSPDLITTQVFRDPSSWYHIVLVSDTTQATSTNRIRMYVNGTQITAFSTATYPAQNAQNTSINNTYPTTIGAASATLDGYLAEVNFIDGQALTPSYFGTFDSQTGVWQPKAYSGTYGTNGFKLNFSNGTSTTTLGYDSSGNSNNWTTNNLSLTAGSTYDWMLDSPTPFAGSSYGVGNYCTLNPVSIYVVTPTDGNLNFSGSSAGGIGSIAASSGKYYWECVYSAIGSADGVLVGVRSSESVATGSAQNVGYYGGGTANGKKVIDGGAATTYGATWTTGDVIGVALDIDGGTITFYKNNVSQGAISYTFTGKSWVSFNWRTGAAVTANTGSINFGQRPFAYTPPTGFKALCTYNLPAASIVNGASYMAATTYTGTGATQSIVNAGGFQPDLVWIKDRTAANSHYLQDVIRGSTNRLASDSTAAEATVATGVTSFNSNGFSLGSWAGVNTSGDNLIAWQWKANGAAVSNTAGSITSQVSANTTSGFAVVTYTGTGANATVGHGLGVTPSMVIYKARSLAGENWPVYHVGITNPATNQLRLNATTASEFATNWNSTNPTSSVFSVGSGNATNSNTNTYVAYCFAAIAGYSAFGSYTGNGSADGPFIYTGFRPRYVLTKNITNAAFGYWIVIDTSRNPYNAAGSELFPNDSSAEYNGGRNIDILSNGFKQRDNAYSNRNGETYIYAAFAESPFQNSLAR